jgi:hypothetical protein
MIWPMPEIVGTVILMIYQKYIGKRWWRLLLATFGLARSEWGAGKGSVSVQGVICFRILLYDTNRKLMLGDPTGYELESHITAREP